LVAGRALVVMRPALTIVLTNHKGGCGKTTSTANLGAAFAERGVRALPASEALVGVVADRAHEPSPPTRLLTWSMCGGRTIR